MNECMSLLLRHLPISTWVFLTHPVPQTEFILLPKTSNLVSILYYRSVIIIRPSSKWKISTLPSYLASISSHMLILYFVSTKYFLNLPVLITPPSLPRLMSLSLLVKTVSLVPVSLVPVLLFPIFPPHCAQKDQPKMQI